ncbi:MAG: regulatory protein [Chloroflexota bacterium]|nr:regulatory protein [Chloroflexota bacterium]
MRRAGYNARAADEACRRAEALGYLNDRAFADALVGKRLRQGRGRMLIGRELGHKGLDETVVGEALGDVDAAAELRSAVPLAVKLLRRHASEEAHRQREKVLGALARRGFSGSVSRDALAQATSQEGLSSES